MAKGDTKAAVTQVSTNSSLLVQPGSGEEWMITMVSTYGDGSAEGTARLTDGTNQAAFFLKPTVGIGEGDATNQAFRDGKIFITNTIYLYIYNESASSQYVSYSGVQWK